MKYSKVLLLGSAAALALAACSDLAVSNSVMDNYPAGFTYAGYMAANPDLVDMQKIDQVTIANSKYEASFTGTDEELTALKTADEAAFVGDTAQMISIGEKFGGFSAGYLSNSENFTGKVTNYLKKYNLIYTQNDVEELGKLPIDTTAIAEQYLVHGKKAGRAFRLCTANDANLVKRGDCQSDDAGAFFGHLYCADEATKAVYCLDCDAATETCPEVITPKSSSAAKPASSASAEPTAESSSAGAAEPAAESSAAADPAAASSSDAAVPTAESSSTVTE